MRDAQEQRTPDLIQGQLIAGYVRPHHDDPDCERQRDALLAEGCTTIYKERSDATSSPALEKAISLLDRGDKLVVARLECLADSLQQLVTTLSALDMKGIAVASVNDRFESTQHSGVFQLLTAFEKQKIKYATYPRLKKVGKGNPTGRRPKLGFEQVVKANAMLAKQEPKAAVAREIGVSRTTLYKYIEEGVLQSHAK